MASLFASTFASIKAMVSNPGAVTILLDDQAGNGTTAPGDATNGAWVNVKTSSSDTVLGTTADAKVDTDAAGTVSSKLRGIVSRLVSLDGKVTTAAAAADGAANPTAGIAQSVISAFNGATWDRLRSGLSAATATITGYLAVIPFSKYNATTPTLTDGQVAPPQVNKRGSAHVVASARHSRRLDLTVLTSGVAAAYTQFVEGPCDALRTDTDNLIVYRQPTERALIASQNGADWTCAAGWTYDAGTHTFTHAAGGGAGDLEITPTGISQIGVGDTYCCLYYVTITAGTSVTMKLGTGVGTVKGATGQEVKLITSAANGKIIFTPTNDLACTIDAQTIYVIPGSPPLAANVDEPESSIAVVAVASSATPATLNTTAKLWGKWLRRAGAVELV